jgi:hypothetical protein
MVSLKSLNCVIRLQNANGNRLTRVPTTFKASGSGQGSAYAISISNGVLYGK